MAFPSREQKHPKNLVRCYEPWSCDFQSVHTEHPKALRSHDALQISGLALGFIDVIFSVLPFILRHTAREKDDLRFCVSPKYCDPCWSGWSKIHAGCRLSDLFPGMNHTSEALTKSKIGQTNPGYKYLILALSCSSRKSKAYSIVPAVFVIKAPKTIPGNFLSSKISFTPGDAYILYL